MQVLVFVTVMLVDLSFVIMHVTGSVAIIQLEVFAALLQVAVSALNMWVTIFIAFMQVGVPTAIMQVLLSAVHSCIYCKIQVSVSVISVYVTLSSNNFIFLSLTGTHKIDRKTFKGIISGLHFTTFVNILPKLRYFQGRNYIQNC